jgi:hypothetical protein
MILHVSPLIRQWINQQPTESRCGMNQATGDLLFDVVARLEKNIVARDCPAIVAIEGERRLILSDYDYLRDEQAATDFEARAAVKAKEIGTRRWVFAVPQVWMYTPGTLFTRAVSNHPLREGEQEAITWMSYDQGDGVDYGRVAYARRPSGEPVFEEPEVFAVGITPTEIVPGYRLLQAMLINE